MFLILSAIIFECHAQQTILFRTIDESGSKKYTLPNKVTCTFANGEKKQLVLTQVKGDSLIFERYYNQQQNYNCTYSSLKGIRFHKKGEAIIYTLFGASLVALPLSVIVLSDSFVHQSTEAGDPTVLMERIIGLPMLVIGGSTALICGGMMPKKFKPGKWTLHVR